VLVESAATLYGNGTVELTRVFDAPIVRPKSIWEDSLTKGRKFLQVRCWMCGRSSLLDAGKPDLDASTFIAEPFAQPDGLADTVKLDDSLPRQSPTLDLPSDKLITISLVAGTSLAMKRQMIQPLLTIGWLGGADYEIDDPQVSRLHCAIEVKRNAVFSRDLRSTNGTYLDEKRILSA